MKIFDSIQVTQPKRNAFDLSHEVKMSGNMGKLMPMFIQETIPGDKFVNNSEIFIRMMPMLAPVMHRTDVYTHFFFVPNRIIFKQWDKFLAKEKVNGLDVVMPRLLINSDTAVYHKKGSLTDYFGIKPITDNDISEGIVQTPSISALPYLAYHKIWNDFYRDQNLQEEVDIETACTTLQSSPGNVFEAQNLTSLKNRAYEKDYFTSCLPQAQKGEPVSLPLGENAPVNFVNNTNVTKILQNGIPSGYHGEELSIANSLAFGSYVSPSSEESSLQIDNSENLEVDLTQATATTVNDLRRAFKLQEWLERNARAGSRYIELILSHFGRRVKDYRLQRPEYIGGGKQPIVISEVLSNVKTATEPQGNMTGHGVSIGKTNSFSYECDEHGWIIGILSVMPRTAYMDGIPKMFTKLDSLDYYWPSFAQLGEQEVKIEELAMDYATAEPEISTFGYQSRYAEYKYAQSRVSGEMRDTLLAWHLARKFGLPSYGEGGAFPALNEDFIKCDPSHRIFAVEDPTEDKLIIQIFNYTKGIRPIPYFNNPSIL